ncbi:hypothetical protein ACFQ1E_07045 [Sphingomonas canadensis]|uniref:Uncharacterized protein n=1 Tax=Sphingomonas canadensis TaxID=1219257 RepID=A0ABW3H3Y5_9SPHN|nr:hypothetical protein [Sphingomonas canadensis]MCW3835456.1 hypothetical protein [Sphingomonas canadensis]
MKILCLARAYNSYGASILTSASQHLELTLKAVEPADLAIEVIAFIRHEGPARPTLEQSLERHIEKFPQQVRARYRAKAGKLDLEYPSKLREAESFARPGGIYAVAHILPRALDELSEALIEGLRLKSAIWSKIDVSRFNAAIEEAKAALPASPDELLAYMRQMDEARKAARKVPTSVDDLDIEWAKYHPDARRALNAPFFWSETDDDSPHGNDTGSDLLAAFKGWNKRNPTASYEGYVDRLLRRWGLTPEKARGQIDEIQLDWIRQEADIALAFAAIKLRGRCDEAEISAAIRALDQRLGTLSGAPERVEKIRLLRSTLHASVAIT